MLKAARARSRLDGRPPLLNNKQINRIILKELGDGQVIIIINNNCDINHELISTKVIPINSLDGYLRMEHSKIKKIIPSAVNDLIKNQLEVSDYTLNNKYRTICEHIAHFSASK